MSSDDEDAVAALAEEIARYLAANQGARDTVDGITRWWIARQRLLETRSMVEKALRHLEAQGRVRPQRNAGGELVYGAVAPGGDAADPDASGADDAGADGAETPDRDA
ncbi:hypothetical protein [uncultured Thiohalocapsa sp.]|uniref:hypothetical protein n=1 Tax=uncultured Thiohalocapsa sp. TaxID=768990 RepID=UPI0025F9CF90|nr:hypothetical protein [uncultured Thiohalocapsa sp.]